jgi:hypothetical protein
MAALRNLQEFRYIDRAEIRYRPSPAWLFLKGATGHVSVAQLLR